MKIDKSVTSRGFRLIEFLDFNGIDCSIQESSLATEDTIWVGTTIDRMHISRKQAEKIGRILIRFAQRGSLS